MLLQLADLLSQALELFRLAEGRAAVGRVEALQVEVTASLAGRLAITLDFAALAFVAGGVSFDACCTKGER